MTIEQDYAAAEADNHPLTRLTKLCALAKKVDGYRRMVAEQKGLTALAASRAGVTQRGMAEETGVSNAMVQQWVKRGRELESAAHPF